MKGVTHLGEKNTQYAVDYAPELLETFENKHPDKDYWVKFNCFFHIAFNFNQGFFGVHDTSTSFFTQFLNKSCSNICHDNSSKF